jgi:hypothetical protein
MRITTKQLLPLILVGCLSVSCGADKKTQNQQENAEANSSSEESKSTTAAAKSCLMDLRQNNIRELVSVQKVAEILGIPADKINVRDNSNIHKTSFDLIACLFETASDTQEGTISVGQIKEEDPSIFKTKYNDEYYSSDGREARYLEDKIGDAAVYLYVSGNVILNVLHGQESFIVQIYGNKKSNEDNLEVAKKVALEVLKKCQ